MGRVRTGITLSSAATLAAGGYLYAGRWPDSQLFGRTLLGGDDPRTVLLTFDDGPNPRMTERLLDVLAGLGVRATFFLIGSLVRRNLALARRVHEAGHVVGNHTMHHPSLLWTSPARVRAELLTCSRVLEDAIGAPVRYMRPPFGARRPDVLRSIRSLGLVPVLWNVGGADWKPGETGLTIASRCLAGIERARRRQRGSNLLLHDGDHALPDADRSATLAAVPGIVEAARARGHMFRTVADIDPKPAGALQ